MNVKRARQEVGEWGPGPGEFDALPRELSLSFEGEDFSY